MFIPVVPNQSSSPFAMELGQKLVSAIREYQQSHPGMSGREIRDALRIAEMSSGASGAARGMIASIVPALLLIGIFIALTLTRRPGLPSHAAPQTIAPFLVALVVLIALALLRMARR